MCRVYHVYMYTDMPNLHTYHMYCTHVRTRFVQHGAAMAGLLCTCSPPALTHSM